MSTQSKAGKGHPCSPLTTLCIAIALASTGVTLPLTQVLADNLPQGGQVIGGQATISQQGKQMDVNTSSARTAINWQRFNVGPDHRITFNQPDGKSVTLNRVIGGDPSKIYGAITSNGQLILVNPNGVMIGPNARITSSALVASAGFLTEEQARQFSATGKLDIQLTGAVTNQGHITVHDNGMVALLGAQVNNAGVIQAKKGMVQLATGPTATLDFHGDGLLNIAVGGEPGERNSVNGDVTGGVHNSGEIDVGNGTVAMSAQRAAKHLDSVINVGGNLVADSVSHDGGTIVLGNSARTNVTGNLSAKGVNGGQIKVLGDDVNLAGTAKVDASGTQGAGGKVLVGGSYQGRGPEQAAKSTTVAKGAQLKADGKTDGGQVVVWSDGKTHFAGSASAQGGQKGGVVETSGKQLTVAPEAQVSTRGGQQSGKWLLDPETVNINADGGAPGSDTVSASAIASNLKNGDVEIAASNRINVNSAIVAPEATGHTLRLLGNGSVAALSDYQNTGNALADAKRNDSGSVYINAPILLRDGHLFILATGDVLLNDNSAGKTGDAAYLGRAIIDVGQGTVWIKTSNSASVIQQDNTALIGDKVAVQGASVLLQSPLNYAGTLAGKASNGVFHYNQTANGEVNTGKVDIQNNGVTESLDGIKAQTIEKLGQQTIWNREGDEVHTLSYNGQSFEYLIFEAIDYVDNKGNPLDMSDKKYSALADTDYKVKSISFIDSVTGDRWTISSNPNAASLLNVLKNGVATTELPPGFSLSAAQGAVVSDTDGWGVLGGAGDQGKNPQAPGITDNRSTGKRDQLLVDLGTNTTQAQANFTSMWHDGNAYERGVVTYLGGRDNSATGGVQLNSQKAQLEGKIGDVRREYGEANPEPQMVGGLTAGPSANSQAVKGVDDFVDRQLNQNRFDAKVTAHTDATEHARLARMSASTASTRAASA
ncbi:filamentous hemagglutinin N-terminal domain-containing protein [Pseudomonas sp. 30_B]|uniref:two-partner secretion domain-containing protein n=1 Tax=Pseudomonas sp. 30_B TaxID=2813575 RepID=UPI001A9DA9A4|nr:filamentous hemagglutinin N-terminal domain-containing protein [Pseudomonas sp. 30_B]